MENKYKDLRSFWDKMLIIEKADKIESRFIEDEVFNDTLDLYFKDGNTILDYGCGSGWATFELALAFKQSKLIGIDPSSNAIDYCNRTKKVSELNNVDFIEGDETNLINHNDMFDNIVTFNVIDVVPNNIIENILNTFSQLLKKDGRIIIGINPEFPDDFLSSRGFIKKDGYLYKDNILRGNEKTNEEWISLFNNYFKVIETKTFTVVDQEKQYPRRMFVLKHK